EMIIGETVASGGGGLARRLPRVEIKHAEHLVPTLHRHADDFADTVLKDAPACAKSPIVSRVGYEDARSLLHDMIDNRVADRNLFLGFPIRPRLDRARF